MFGIKSQLIKYLAKRYHRQVERDGKNAVSDQLATFKYLIQNARKTKFGKEHGFEDIKNFNDFSRQVPLRDYEALSSYIKLILNGESDVLWPGKPKYFAKTSGTTSGIKYIPITNQSIKNHINTARNTLFNHIYNTKQYGLFKGKMIFLSGSPELQKKAGILTGRLSGIVYHEMPFYVKGNRLPDYQTNAIEDWEEKLDKIVDITLKEDMCLISGIPPWIQMYYERLLQKSGKKSVKDLFPNYELFVFGGVNYAPYKNILEELLGKSISTLETYPASEGFIAFQNDPNDTSLLLNTHSGIYYEFIPLNEYHDENPRRLNLEEVELNVDYAIILSNNAGLWAYKIGDTIRFISKDPYKIIVSGRVKHFISAFGEHVIAKEVEQAIQTAMLSQKVEVKEFTVAPQVNPESGAPYHEWFIDFSNPPKDLRQFAEAIDDEMINQNIYYQDLRKGEILQQLKITCLAENAFQKYMHSIGKLGGQNKVPRLSNDRVIADALKQFVLKK